MKKVERILFIGSANKGSNALSLYNSFRRQNREVFLIDTQYYDIPHDYSLRRIIKKFLPNVYGRVASIRLGIRIRGCAEKYNPDVIFVFKGNYVSKKALLKLRSLKVHFHPDDSSNLINRTQIFDFAESSYDLHFTPKRHNVREIIERTGKKAIFVWYAYDSFWHNRDSSLSFERSKFELGFVGHMRPDRKELILKIASIYGKRFAITGSRWKRIPRLSQMATVFSGAYECDFSNFIQSAPLQLGLLNSDNRDQHTARSFEVPASGGLLLAEDTFEHREMFKSEENALFFKSFSELIEKIEWVRANPQLAQRIADNGYRHITQNSNSWDDRANEMINVIDHFEV